MTRIDGRKFDELRPVTIDAGFVDYAPKNKDEKDRKETEREE